MTRGGHRLRINPWGKGAGVVAGLLLAVGLLLVSCSGDAERRTASQGRLSGRITVFAAASLSDAFNAMAAEFEQANPDAEVRFNFGGSPTLRVQLEQGARADVYASADLSQMTLALQNGVVADGGRVFTRNSLVLITPRSNPGKIEGPADLRRGGLKLVLANAEVPVGAYSRQALAAMEQDAAFGAGFSDAVLRNVVSLESNVKQVVAKVELGEADAGIVYGSDVTVSVAPRLAVIQIPARHNPVAKYPIALTREAANPALARAFIDFVLSPAGQRILQQHGFLTASS